MTEEGVNLVQLSTLRSPVYKVFFGGRSAVGKSSLLRRYIEGVFDEHETATIGADYKTIDITRDNFTFRMQLWDTSGQDRFQPFIKESIIHNTQVMIFVFALDEKDSLGNLVDWINRVKDEHLLLRVLVGNKSDLETKREVFMSDVQPYIDNYEMHYYETSAKNGQGVDDVFDYIIKYLISESYTTASDAENFFYTADDDELKVRTPKKKKSCLKKLFCCCCCNKEYAEI